MICISINLSIGIAALEETTSNVQTYDFDFQLTNGTIVSISDFSDKPVLIDWAASWCSICKKNQQNMDIIYDAYKDEVHFLTISYGGSGDDLSKVLTMKGSYEWLFGLDHANFASTVSVRNGYVWILDNSSTLINSWSYSIVSVNTLQSSLDTLLGVVNTKTTTIPGADLGLLQSLFENPIFIIFFGFVAISAVVVIIIRLRK